MSPLWVRQTAARLFAVLPPQERAAVWLKDVFDLTLEDRGDVKSSVGVVKSALHRGRVRLRATGEARAASRACGSTASPRRSSSNSPGTSGARP